MLASDKINASPEELAAAYAHAAGGDGGTNGKDGEPGRGLTLEHLAAFATYSAPHVKTVGNGGGGGGGGCWEGWLGAARPGDGGVAARRALVKARIKCRDAGLLGRSFPGEAFARLDPEGSGRVSRPAFKRALREMGFALVDEAAETSNHAGLLCGNEQWHASKEGQERSSQEERAATSGGVLGNTVEEDTAKDDEEVRLRKVEGEEDEQKRKAFRAKVEEIERSAAEKVSCSCVLNT